MLLAIDIGNTNIAFGVFKGSRIYRKFSMPSREYSLPRLKNLLGGLKPVDAILCSVVPGVSAKLSQDLRRLLPGKIYILGKNTQTPLKNRYRNPGQVGQDRLVNAFAGVNTYGTPLIAVDFGTAVTFDIICANKEYLGGMILPGLRISLEALHKETALLPRVALKHPAEFIGRDTKSSMLSGVVYGFASLSDELIKKIKRITGRNTKVVGTGGDIGLISKFSTQITYKDADLTLKGLYLIYTKNT